jgi:enoyl-CoA hydratase/carnithine racemase
MSNGWENSVVSGRSGLGSAGAAEKPTMTTPASPVASVHIALGGIKALASRFLDGLLPRERNLEAERLAQIENAATSDFKEGLTAFLQKRPPKFS